MKATLEFNMDDSADREMHKHSVNALKYIGIIQEIDGYLRAQIKYGDLPEEIKAAHQEVRDYIYKTCGEHGVEVWE